MAISQPPGKWDDRPRIVPLPAGERLWRIHDRGLGSCTFSPPRGHNPPDDNRWDEGRFDANADDPFPTLYVAQSAEAAAAECLARAVPFNAAGHRSISLSAITDRSVSVLNSTRPLRLIALLTPDDLRRVAQDDWLITAEPRDYTATQEWGRWLRALAPEAQGLIWPSALCPGVRLMVLFGDRIPVGSVVPGGQSIELDTAEGATWLNATLKPWRISAPPGLTDLRTADDEGQGLLTAAGVPGRVEGEPAEALLPDFRVFWEKYRRDVRNIVHAAVLDWDLAEDATQEAMIITYKNWDTVAHHANPVGYAVKTAKRIAFRVKAKEAREVKQGLLGTFDINNTSQAGDAADRLTLEQALRQISPKKAEVFLLHYYKFTEQEIARYGGIPAGTVKSQLYWARRELRMLLRSTFGGLGRFP